MGVESVVSAVAPTVVGSLLGGNDSGGGGSTTTTATNEPWSAIKPYLVGGTQKKTLKAGVKPIYKTTGGDLGFVSRYDDQGNPVYSGGTGGQQELANPDSDYDITGTPGIADEAARLYGTTGMTQAQKDALAQQQGMNSAYLNDNSLYKATLGNAQKANNGGFDTNITPAQESNLQMARASQGVVDPTQSLQKLLSGNPDNPYLAQQANTLSALSNQNLMQNIMPQLDHGAVAAGQYGSSRQGIAQGVAAGNAQVGLNNSIAGLYGNAYQQAQQNMYGTANALNQQAGQNAQFNSQLQLANNSQQMQQAQNNLNNRVQGANLTNLGIAGQNNLYAANNTIYDTLRNEPWQELAKYQSVIQPLAGMGNTQTQTNPYFTNTGANMLGGAAMASGIAKNLGLFGSGGNNGYFSAVQAGSMNGNGSVQGNSDYYYDL